VFTIECLRLDNLDALYGNVVFIAMNTCNPQMADGEVTTWLMRGGGRGLSAAEYLTLITNLDVYSPVY